MKFEVIQEVHEPEKQPVLEQCATYSVGDDGKLTFEMLADAPLCQAALETAERDGGILALIPDTVGDREGQAYAFVPVTDPNFPGALGGTIMARVKVLT